MLEIVYKRISIVLDREIICQKCCRGCKANKVMIPSKEDGSEGVIQAEEIITTCTASSEDGQGKNVND